MLAIIYKHIDHLCNSSQLTYTVKVVKSRRIYPYRQLQRVFFYIERKINRLILTLIYPFH